MAKRFNPHKQTKEQKAAKKIKGLIFKSLDKIYETCETGAAEFGAKSVPLSFLKLCIEKTKEGFEAGAKQQQPK